MSALLERPVSKGTQTLPRTQRARRVTGKPQVEPRIHIRARIITRKKPEIARIVLTKTAVFGVVLGLTFMASSFGGQVMLEGARQQRMEAKRRAKDAKEAEAILSARLAVITSATGIEQWALEHGFVAPESQQKKMEGLLARR